MEDNLEVSRLKENELNEQIKQFQIEIALVYEKLKEVEKDRDDNLHNISDHHRGKISELKKEREDLEKKYEELTILYEESKKRLEGLNNELKKSQSLSSKLEEDFIATCEKLKDEGNRNRELEGKIEIQINNFTNQISNLKKLSKEEESKLVQ